MMSSNNTLNAAQSIMGGVALGAQVAGLEVLGSAAGPLGAVAGIGAALFL